MSIVLSLFVILVVMAISADRRTEKACWILYFLSFSVHVSLYYIYVYSDFIGKQSVGVAVTLTDLISTGMLIGYIIKRRKWNKVEINVLSRFFAYVVFACLSLIYSYNKGMSINELGTLVQVFITMAVIILYFKKEFLNSFVYCIVFNACIQAAACLLQMFTGIGFRSSEALTIRYGVYRCVGLYISPAELSLISIITFLILFVFYMQEKQLPFRVNRGLYKLGMLCSVFTLITGQSRVGFLVFFLALVLVAFAHSRYMNTNTQKSLRLLTVFGVLSVVALFVFGAIDIGNSVEMAISRFTMWEMGWDIFKEHPLLGVGVNAYTAFNSDFSKSVFVWEKTNPIHNIFLLELAETGFIGTVLLFVNYYFAILKYAYKRLMQCVYAKLLFIILFIQLLYGFTGWVFYSPSLRFFNVAVFAILIAMISSDIKDGKNDGTTEGLWNRNIVP